MNTHLQIIRHLTSENPMVLKSSKSGSVTFTTVKETGLVSARAKLRVIGLLNPL